MSHREIVAPAFVWQKVGHFEDVGVKIATAEPGRVKRFGSRSVLGDVDAGHGAGDRGLGFGEGFVVERLLFQGLQ